MRGRAKAVFLALLALLGLGLVGNAVWIHAKALLAQQLLEAAWQTARLQQQGVRPWPWADSWPMARLSVARLGIEQIVLEGDDGSALAFGPGHTPASALPGESGRVVISGHRDTHFSFLRHLQPGDKLELETLSGRFAYRIREMGVVDAGSFKIAATSGDELILVTCYPFDALVTGGPLRYLVVAEREAGVKL